MPNSFIVGIPKNPPYAYCIRGIAFYTIGNCANRPCRFALFGYKKNLDRQATSGGCYPLFISFVNVRN